MYGITHHHSYAEAWETSIVGFVQGSFTQWGPRHTRGSANYSQGSQRALIGYDSLFIVYVSERVTSFGARGPNR